LATPQWFRFAHSIGSVLREIRKTGRSESARF